jgi:hypothetical protein
MGPLYDKPQVWRGLGCRLMKHDTFNIAASNYKHGIAAVCRKCGIVFVLPSEPMYSLTAEHIGFLDQDTINLYLETGSNETYT